MEKPTPYLAYLIRLWPTRRGGVADYRVSLQSVDTGQSSHFPDLNSLAEFLLSQAQNSGTAARRRPGGACNGPAAKEDVDGIA